MPGPSKQPRVLKIIAGTDQPCRREADGPEFTKLDKFPEPPSTLNVDGAEMWRALGVELIGCGVLQVVDLWALELTCYAWQQFRKDAKADRSITASDQNALIGLLGQFGLSPQARRRIVSGVGSKKENPFKKWAKH